MPSQRRPRATVRLAASRVSRPRIPAPDTSPQSLPNLKKNSSFAKPPVPRPCNPQFVSVRLDLQESPASYRSDSFPQRKRSGDESFLAQEKCNRARIEFHVFVEQKCGVRSKPQPAFFLANEHIVT